ncbi:MAG: hypothetical protein PHE38_06320 [Alishewanella agri]|nr:hypothetical protein [Alishewanella agri]
MSTGKALLLVIVILLGLAGYVVILTKPVPQSIPQPNQPTITATGSEEPLPRIQTAMLSEPSSESPFPPLSPIEDDLLDNLQQLLFGLLDGAELLNSAMLRDQGYPGIEELRFAANSNATDFALWLANHHRQQITTPHSGAELNVSALRVLSFVKAVTYAEQVIRYQQPDFSFNAANSFSQTSLIEDEQVRDALTALIFASATLGEELGLEALAKARYQIVIANWNNEDLADDTKFLRHFATAAKQLPQLAIDSYVETHYPERYAEYLEYKNSLK